MQLSHGRVALWLQELQAGEGLALLLLHELGGSARDWRAHACGWPGPVHALDFAGHGLSGRVVGGAYTAELLAGDADAALSQLGRAAVAGSGLGAYVALLLAGARPDRVPAALLLPGEGFEGGGAVPDFERTPDVELPDAATALRPGIQTAPDTDRRAVAALRDEIRPPDYAEAFARAAHRLLLVEDGVAPPPWWRGVRQLDGVETLAAGAGIAPALQALARAAAA